MRTTSCPLQPGVLVVARRPVTFVADSDLGKVYDGEEQGVSTWHALEGDGQGLVAGHEANVAAEGRGAYNDAHALVRVSVGKAGLSVRSFAWRDDPQGAPRPVSAPSSLNVPAHAGSCAANFQTHTRLRLDPNRPGAIPRSQARSKP